MQARLVEIAVSYHWAPRCPFNFIASETAIKQTTPTPSTTTRLRFSSPRLTVAEVLLSLADAATALAEAVGALLAAVARLDAPDYLFALVDWRMPGLDGIATLRRLRAHYAGRAAPPLLLMTMFSHDEHLRSSESEFDGFLSKPTSVTHLYSEVALLLGLKSEAGRRGGLHSLKPVHALRGAEVLLVEDTELNQEVLRDLLESAGMRVRIANNGQEALEAIALARPDCVLMDCQMPVMDGYEATRLIKAQERFRDLPIIALTANAMPSDRERCFQAGMDGYVAKPVYSGELFSALSAHISAPAAPAAGLPPTRRSGAPLPALAGIDIETGLLQANDKPDLYRKLLKGFRDRNDFEAEFRQALAALDWETAIRQAHTLKGVAKTIGAFGIGQIAAELERATQAHDLAAIAATLARLLPDLAQVRNGLLQLDQDSAPGALPAAAATELRPLLARVIDLLEQRDAGAADQVPALRAALTAAGRDDEGGSIAAAIERYDYTRATIQLRALSESI